MKNLAITVFILLALAILTSCEGNKKDVDVQYQLTVSVDVRNVVKNLKDLDNTDYFSNGVIPDEDYRVRINLFIYKEDGSLVGKETQIVDNFYKKMEVKKSMDTGKYTLVASADIVESSGSNVEFEFWKFENTDDLRSLRVVDLKYVGFYYKAIGISKKTIEIEKSESQEIVVDPIGSLITFHFYNASASKIAYIVYEWNKSAEYYRVDDEEANVINATVGSDFEVTSQYTGYYDPRYFLPTQNIELIWGTLTAAEKVVNAGSKVFNIQKGVNQILSIDVQSGSTQLKSDTRATLPVEHRNHKKQSDPSAPQQSLRIIDLK
jgi:hypothetical protein